MGVEDGVDIDYIAQKVQMIKIGVRGVHYHCKHPQAYLSMSSTIG